MRTSYRIDINDRSMYPMGATVIEGGMHVSFVSKGTECALLLYKKGARPVRSVSYSLRNPESAMCGA